MTSSCAKNLTPQSPPTYAFYNPPWTLALPSPQRSDDRDFRFRGVNSERISRSSYSSPRDVYS